MNSASLKLFACALMIVDHVGIIFYPDIAWLRLIGRLVFPLFAYLIAEGYRYTHDMTGYLGRLLLFSLFSQPIYMWAFQYPTLQFNVLFTLAVGLYAIYVYDRTKSFLQVVLIGVACEVVHSSYGLPGVLIVVAMHLYHKDLKKLAVVLFPLLVISGLNGIIRKSFALPDFTWTLSFMWAHCKASMLEPFAIMCVPLIALYDHTTGRKMKYLFYVFYPGHLAILGYIRHYIIK
ncbi:MAG: TraX family protein [Syntrophobacteraceae bacterium]